MTDPTPIDSLRSDLDALTDRVNDLETHVLAKLRRDQSRSLDSARRLRLLVYGLSGLVVLAMVGLRLDNGEIDWAYNDVAVTQIAQLLGLSGVAGFGSMAIASLRERPRDTDTK